MKRTIFAVILLALFVPALLAQDQSATTTNAQTPVKPTVNQREKLQQQRIGQGVENGSLTAGEAARLERRETRINNEVKTMRQQNGGKLTPAERARVNRQQNQVSRQIYRDKHNAAVQAPANGPINDRKRMQQERIGQGIKSGSLTPGEAAKLEGKEARLNREERTMRVNDGGKLTPAERQRINRQQNRISGKIYHEKHDAAHQ
jgi:hypothetical protein